MNEQLEVEAGAGRRRGFSGSQVALIVLGFVVVAVGLTLWLARVYLFPQPFEPVELSARESARLEAKLRQFEGLAPAPRRGDQESDQEWLRPEAYSEEGAPRRLSLSERELNSILARDPQLARRVAIDLSRNLASARVLIPVDPDFPLLGGRTLRVAAGLELSTSAGRPVMTLRGVSVMGVPIPSAWLGGLKNQDLIAQFGDGPGFWQGFAAGIEDIRVSDGELVLRLRE